MTAEQKALEALAIEKAATWNPIKWAARISTDPTYDYTKTPNFKAQVALWEAAQMAKQTTPPPPPPKPPGVDTTLGRSWIFMAENPDKALWYPPYYGVAFTADPAYQRPSAQTIAALKGRGQRVRTWCDCHSTFPTAAKAMAHNLGLDGWIGEGESASAFDTAFTSSAQIIVGNLSALRDDQKKLIAEGMVLWINELYWNQDSSRIEDWQNLPVAGRCIAAYDASGENPGVGRRFPVSEYLRLGHFAAHRDSFYDPGATDDDRRALP